MSGDSSRSRSTGSAPLSEVTSLLRTMAIIFPDWFLAHGPGRVAHHDRIACDVVDHDGAEPDETAARDAQLLADGSGAADVAVAFHANAPADDCARRDGRESLDHRV